jgi:hypothetical protein
MKFTVNRVQFAALVSVALFSVFAAGRVMAGSVTAAQPAVQQPAQQAPARASAAAVEQIKGEVFLQLAGSAPEAWIPVNQARPLTSGDSIRTGANGTCAVVYADQATIRLDPNTTITIQDSLETQDILLRLGNIRANVNSQKAVKPFHFVTPTAISAVRGTNVDFGFNEDGLLTIDLHNGNVLVFNDEKELEFELGGGKKVAIYYDYATGALQFKNDCVSSGDVEFIFRGKTYTTKPCDEILTEVATAAGGDEFPNTPTDDDSELVPDEGDDGPPPPVSPSSDLEL